LLLCFAVLLLSAALAAQVEPAIPPPPARWVTDHAGLLSENTRKALDARLEAYERATGHQVVVSISGTIGNAPLDEFATRVFEAWKIGRKGHDDGVLILVLKDDRKIAIEVGYGLEDRLPDAIASRIIREQMAPRLKAGDADGALTTGTDAVLASIDGKPFDATAPPPAAEPAKRRGPSIGQLIFFGILAALFLLLMVTHPELAMALLFTIGRGGGGFGGGGLGGGGFGGGGFSGGGGRSGGGGARGGW
jgi:uncharacterized protein